jgi:alkanesulfonate monooxygenase SsuD/methylene tetrahydromethanopterin reductase-like flavin-dependent oxidoreductase (luciferase family)
VKVGVYLNTQARPRGVALAQIYAELFETVRLMEELGYDAAFLPEHHQQPDGYLPSPFVMAAAILSRTERLRVHTGIHLLPLWDPMRVAEDVAVLDVLSGSRITLGVGLGLVQHEFDQFGVDMRTAVSRFTEQLEILRLAWSDEPVTFHGDHFVYDAIDVHPKPLTTPKIFIGAMSDRSVERAGRLGDGWLTDPLHSAQTIESWAARYRASAVEHGRQPSIWLQRDCYVSENPADIREVWAPYLVDDWRFHFGQGLLTYGRFNAAAEPWAAKVESPDDITFEALQADRVVAGTPQEVTDQLLGLGSRIQPDGVCFRFRFPNGPAHPTVLETIRLFGSDVLPHLQPST